MKINHKMFKEVEFHEMEAWLNTDSHKRTIISITQAKIMISIYFTGVTNE